ncbi:MAG TPA: hypothetical protein VN635_00120 [Conexibacter sp.]|nr:hypothetical protein [Conexibacter sp.]
MAVKITKDGPVYSPASRLMDEAIELAIQERSPYPSRAAFVDFDSEWLAKEISDAFDDDYAVVLVWPDGSSRVLQPGDRIPAPAPSAALKASGSGIDLPAA